MTTHPRLFVLVPVAAVVLQRWHGEAGGTTRSISIPPCIVQIIDVDKRASGEEGVPEILALG